MQLRIKKLAKEAGKLLQNKGLMLAVAESCTGGGLGYYLTAISGSSSWFDRGFVTYSNEAKIEMLSVDEATLGEFGAVSDEAAIAMAQGVLDHCRADVSIAITGIAGPKGGSHEKPVGTVFFAISERDKKCFSFLETFAGNRHAIRLQAIEKALTALIALLQK